MWCDIVSLFIEYVKYRADFLLLSYRPTSCLRKKTYQLIFALLVEYKSISVKHGRREPQNSTKFPIEYIQNFGPLLTSDICHIINILNTSYKTHVSHRHNSLATNRCWTVNASGQIFSP